MKQLIAAKEGALPTEGKATVSDADKWLEVFSILLHDIESPLASMKYILRLIDERKLDLNRPLHRKMVASSRIAFERAESIIFDIMAVARAGKVGLPVRMTSIDPEPVIREAILLASGSAQERNIDINFVNEVGSIPVEVDPDLLKRIADNLLYNAIRHTPSDGTIQVYTKDGQQCIFIHVKDSGPGLPDVDPELLFEKYSQLQQRALGRHRGVGLGLYFCKLAATGMGGTILADNHPEGGAVFSLKLRKSKE